MKNFFILILSLSSALLFGGDSETIFSRDRLVHFYNEFLLEEKDYLADAGLTSHSSVLPLDPFSPPPNPPPPPFKTGLFPVVLVNNSGFTDDQVYVVVTGNNTGGQQAWGQVDTTVGSDFGVATLVTATTGQSSTSFSYSLSQLPRGSTGRVIYLPPITSGLIWFSTENPLHMTVNGNAIVHPSPTNSTLIDYATNFDTFEVAYVPTGSPAISVDATAVSFFSMPLYGYLAGSTSGNSNTGLYQPRYYIMDQAAKVFSAAYNSSQWNNLLLTQGGNVLRCLSPGQAISASLFDQNYLNTYINTIWSGAGAYYASPNPGLNMTVKVTKPSAATYNYTGIATPGGVFTFTSTNGGPDVIFKAAAQGPPYKNSTTYNIFEGLNLVNPTDQPIAGTAADAVSKLFQEAVVAGILPTRNTVSLNSLVSNQAGYYQPNSQISGGPWYDYYSKALHALGLIYTFAYDDALWPQVLLGSPFVNNSTYLGITIGPSK